MSEDKGQVSEIEVDLAVPANGTEEQKTPPNAEQQTPEDQDEDGVAQAGEDDDDRSARAERRKRTRERNRIREMERDALIEQQGLALQAMYEQLQTLGAHAQGGQLTQAQQAHAAAKAQMERAYESGKPSEVAEATEALTIARLNLDALKHRRAPQPTRQPVQTGNERQEQPNPYQQAWLSKNDWYNDPERRRDASVAHAISTSLADEGYSGEDLYVELDRELKKRGIAGEAGTQRAQPKVIVATGQRQSLTPPKTKITLNPRVQDHAERFGINLKDPATAQRIARRFQAQQSK